MFRNNHAYMFQYMLHCKLFYTCPHIDEHNNYCNLLCIHFYNCHYIQLCF